MTESADGCLDIVLDPPVSVSIYLSALTAAGRDDEIDVVRESHHEASRAALDALEHAALWVSRVERDAVAPYEYARAAVEPEIIEHGLGRRGQGLHLHVLVQAPAHGTLDRDAVERAFPFIRSRYEVFLLDSLNARLGVATRLVEGARELAGVPEELIASWERNACRVRAGVPQLRDATGSSSS